MVLIDSDTAGRVVSRIIDRVLVAADRKTLELKDRLIPELLPQLSRGTQNGWCRCLSKR